MRANRSRPTPPQTRSYPQATITVLSDTHGRGAGCMSAELIKRSAFTLGALLVYWFGLYVPLPGIDVAAWIAIFDRQSGGMLGDINALSGGGVRTLSVLSLSITPYVTSAIIIQLLAMVSPVISGFRNDGERGRRMIDLYTIYGAVLLAA